MIYNYDRNQEIKNKVRGEVREIMSRGDGIVSGGALNVDFVATDEALKNDEKAKRIKIFLPTTLEIYGPHMRKHARIGEYTMYELVAFLIKTEMSEGAGTSDTIEKAKRKGVPVKLFEWDLTQNGKSA